MDTSGSFTQGTKSTYIRISGGGVYPAVLALTIPCTFSWKTTLVFGKSLATPTDLLALMCGGCMQTLTNGFTHGNLLQLRFLSPAGIALVMSIDHDAVAASEKDSSAELHRFYLSLSAARRCHTFCGCVSFCGLHCNCNRARWVVLKARHLYGVAWRLLRRWLFCCRLKGCPDNTCNFWRMILDESLFCETNTHCSFKFVIARGMWFLCSSHYFIENGMKSSSLWVTRFLHAMCSFRVPIWNNLGVFLHKITRVIVAANFPAWRLVLMARLGSCGHIHFFLQRWTSVW